MSASAELVVARHASEIVSTDAPGGPSTSQTIMVSSLQQLLLRLPADAPPAAYKAAVMDENVLGKATTSGHVGIVIRLLPDSINGSRVETIEGNTGNGAGVVREGDGVYRRVRSLAGSDTMKVKGFLRCWNPTK